MGKLLILSPAEPAALAVSRGSGGDNLLSRDPKEVWEDSAGGSAATIDIDFGAVRLVDTVCLAAIYDAAAGASWTITGGTATYADATVKATGALRAVDAAGQFPSVSHALWTGTPVSVRYLRISITQPAGSLPLQIGRLLAGAAFVPGYGQEWSAGRRVIDTGVATRLPSGGFTTVEGARAGSYAFTLGDLTSAEVDALYALQKAHGETVPLLLVEDPAATTGQLDRIHYGLFTALRAFERRNPAQTRWELTIEEWI